MFSSSNSSFVPSQSLPGVAFVSGATGFNFAPKADGGSMLFIVTKRGELVALENPDTDTTLNVKRVFMLSRLCSNGERGLQSVLPHPNFLQNRWIYLYYTYDKSGGCQLSATNGAVNRLSRFTVGDDLTINASTELVLIETAPLPDRVHNGGDMIFGNDGNIWLTIGDGGARDNDEPQNLRYLFGSIVRITDTGSIPSDNPYTGSDSARCNMGGVAPAGSRCQEIWASGVRNPFRFALDPHTPNSETRFFINDVGGSKWEEISEGGTDFKGANYGYREREGPCRIGSVDNCSPEDDFKDPFYWYQHNQVEEGAITGGAFVPNGLWPGEYDNTYMFSDFVYKQIYVLREDEDAACPGCSPPRPGWVNQTFMDLGSLGQPVQLAFGPYEDKQALYYSLWAPTGINIRRVVYSGGGNRSPTAIIIASTTDAAIGMEINFDGTSSSDPDNDELFFIWDFGDGSIATDGITTHSYDAAGSYIVSLTVVDAQGFESEDVISIDVGSPPTVLITSPEIGAEFAVGDFFTLAGSATDSNGNEIPDSSWTWEVRQRHGTHAHQFLDPTVGNNIEVGPAPPPEDFEASTNSYLEISLTATDSRGASSTTVLDIQPKTVMIDFVSEPPGLQLILDGFGIIAPTTAVSWLNHRLEISAPDQGEYSFTGWSDGGESTHIIDVTDSETVFVATFETPPMPTSTPTKLPSAAPSMIPTKRPTTTSTPTTDPTEVPSSDVADTPTDTPAQVCIKNEAACMFNSECCSMRCVLGTCKTTRGKQTKATFKFGYQRGRGGAAGGLSRRRRLTRGE